MSAPGRSPRQVLRQRRNAALATPNADGSPLEGYVESPADGDDVDRRFVMSGWHAWDRQPVAAVIVEMDGRIIGRAQSSDHLRDDVAQDRNDDRYAATGWEVELDLGGVHTATAVLTATVFPAEDRTGVRLDPITVTVVGLPTRDLEGVPIPPLDEVIGNIDVPPSGSTVELGPLAIKGWARSTYSPIARVSIFANGVALGPARLGIDRADVAAEDPAPDAPICGFEQLVDLGALTATDGTVTIRVIAESIDGTVGELVTELAVTAPRDVGSLALPPLPRATGSASELDLLVVTHDLGYGGAQLWLTELLRRAGAGSAFPCTVVAFGGGALVAELTAMGVDVHVTSPLPVEDADAYEGRLAELSSWLDGQHHTAALVNTFRSFPGADLAARRGLPVVWAIHESWPESLIWTFDHPGVRVHPAIRAIASRALAHAGAVIFESEATRALYDDRAHGRTLVVHYGVDTAELDAFAASTSPPEARHALGLEEAGRVMLVMGTVEPRKGQTLLAEAFATVAAAHADATLVLVGDLHTPYSEALRTFLDRAGIAGRTRLEEVTPDALSWYRASDVLICGSDVESLPRSVLDAMALGVPVVATRVFGVAELLDDGDTGLLFEPLDLAAAIGAIERALSMPASDLGGIGERGRALVREKYDSAGYAADVVALLRGLLADPSALPGSILAATPRESGSAQSASS